MEFKIEKENWRKTGVYYIKNKLNDKIYIGSTSVNFRHRYLQYCSAYRRKLHNQPILYRAFEKYGFENFYFNILETCSKQDCIKLEQFYINKGTDYNSCLIAGSLLGFKHSENSKTRTLIGGKHHCSKPVYQFSKEGIYIRKYNSLTEALVGLGKGKNGLSHITDCCNGKTYSAFGYRWSFDWKKVERESRIGKHKVAISKDNFYKEFSSQTEASEYIKFLDFKCNQGRISRAIKTGEKVYGFLIIKL